MIFAPPRLWAKSPLGSAETTLQSHLEAVWESARAVLEVSGDDILSAFQLDKVRWRDSFARVVLMSAALHDIGKANDHFQAMIHKEGTVTCQGIRHEWVSLLLVNHPQVQKWLREGLSSDLEWHAVQWAVSGHHPRMDRESPPTSPPATYPSNQITVYSAHPDFIESLKGCALWLRLKSYPTLPATCWNLSGRENNVFTEIRKLTRAHDEFWDDAQENRETRAFVAAVKAMLLGCDVAGSALPNLASYSALNRSKWIHNLLSIRPEKEQLESIVKNRLEGRPLRDFQQAVAIAPQRVVFARAGCGSGKTLAAYLRASQHPLWANRRLWFCYPTTGTTTEGFKDYLHDQESPEFRLFHSRAEIDYSIILEADYEPDDSLDKVRSLAAWGSAAVCSTVDTVLGIVQNERKALYRWPSFAQSAFVFDEIHAYDDNLFAAMVKFVSELRGIPFLLMTASLPKQRLDFIKEKLGEELGEVEGPEDLEKIRRYHFAPKDPGSLFETVHQELAKGGKILWVCNTVARAMKFAAELQNRGLLDVPVYHSRFKYPDRVFQHQKVVSAFKKQGPAIVVTTQVAEMSLDLSATLLISDLAPISSLIQRLGRLNRRTTGTSPSAPFWVILPTETDGCVKPAPYLEIELSAAAQWIQKLTSLGRAFSQQDLVDYWDQSSSFFPDIRSTWLTGGPHTEVRPLRDIQQGLQIILESDVKSVTNGDVLIQEVLIPMNMPIHNKWMNWQRCPGNGVLVAPTGTVVYHQTQGASWS